MQKIELEVTTRDLKSDETRNPNQVRRNGFVPGVLYGHGKPVPIVVNAKSFGKAISGKAGTNALFTVKMDGKSDLTVIKEVQRDIFTRHPIHVDFQRISLKEKLEVTIPVHLIGDAPGVKVQQGILEHIQREVKLKCLPDDIPVSIDVDITKL